MTSPDVIASILSLSNFKLTVESKLNWNALWCLKHGLELELYKKTLKAQENSKLKETTLLTKTSKSTQFWAFYKIQSQNYLFLHAKTEVSHNQCYLCSTCFQRINKSLPNNQTQLLANSFGPFIKLNPNVKLGIEGPPFEVPFFGQSTYDSF